MTAEAGEASFGCRNCGASLAGAQRFCGACGQRIIAARLTMRDIGHDLMHALTHADHSIFALAGSLLLRPGRVAREYIDGKRKKHFGPFAFLLIMVGLAAFMLALTGVEWFNVVGDSRIGGLLERHVNFVILLQTPLLAGWCALLFWEQKLHFAEHLVLSAYTSGFRILVLGLILTPLWYFTNVSPARSSAGFFYYIPWMGYFAFAAAQFYRGNVFFIVLRAILVAALGWVSTLAIIFGFIVLFAHFASQ